MNRQPDFQTTGRNENPPDSHLSPDQQNARIMETNRRKDRLVMSRATLIVGFTIAAIFTWLWVQQPVPPENQPLTAEVMRETTTPAVADIHSEEPVSPPPLVTPAPAKPVDPAPETAPAVSTPQETTSPVVAAEPLSGEPELLLTGIDSRRGDAIQRDKDLLNRAIVGHAWDGYRTLLEKSIRTTLDKLPQDGGVNRFDPVWKEAPLYQALLRWKTLGWFSESEINSLVTADYEGGFITWLLNHNEAMEEFLLTIRSGDDGGSVLKFLMDAWSLNERNYQKYFPLALACAVVFDQPVSIPHPLGSTDDYAAKPLIDPLERYLWYVGKNEDGKLAAPVNRSSARDLIWVVCAPVTTSELEWSIDKMHLGRKHWGNAYGMVEYLMERAVDGLDPYEEYSFAEILKEGGICGDQSYFCVNTARAQGIPAMTISGETDLGAHAWAGVKIDSREWTTGVGRVAGASKGQAHNPQTGGSITEQEIQLWNDRGHQSPVVTLSTWRHLWLADFFGATENKNGKASAIRLANQLGRSFPETWNALFSLLEENTLMTGDPEQPDNLEEWKNFARDMRQEFKDNPRMAGLAAEAELKYVFPYGSENDAKRALLRERRRIERESGEQTDLIADALKREAELISKRGGPDAKRDISRLYDRALRDYGGSITGFKMMAQDYFSYFKNDQELARKAARDIELAFKRVVETGTKDWFRANTESSIYKMICAYYRTAGDPDRAEMLEKRYEVLLRRSKRGAL